MVKQKIEVTSKNVLTLPVGRYSLGGGLTLLVSSERARSWIFRYQINGKRRDFSIGSANLIPISSAKAKSKELALLVLEGKDPSLEKLQKKAAGAILFRDFAKDAIDEIESVKRWKNAKHGAQWRSTIETYAFPVIGDIPVKKVTREDILFIETREETCDFSRGRNRA